MQQRAAPDFRPLYSQIRDLLVDRLAGGEWRPGDALPSEAALALEYGVSQGTVRKALNALEAEHLVDRRQGKGTFAAKHDPGRSLFQFFHLFGDDGERQAPDSRVLRCYRASATVRERAALELRRGTDVTRIYRVREMNDRPVITEQITLETRLFPDLHRCAPEEIPNTVYGMYEARYGVTVVRAIERLRAVCATDADAELLGLEAGTPLLEIDRIALNIERKPIEWRLSRCSTEHHHYLNELD